MTSRSILPAEDLQQSEPPASISLTKAGVTRSAKAIRISYDGVEQLFQAEIACFADLNPQQKGVHMSRFEEGINEAIDQVILGEALSIESLAQRIAAQVVSAQGRPAQRGHHSGELPEGPSDAGLRDPEPGDVRADRRRGRHADCTPGASSACPRKA